MFKITQTVTNSSNNSYQLQPYGVIQRNGRPDTIGDECSELKIMDFSGHAMSEPKITQELIEATEKFKKL